MKKSRYAILGIGLIAILTIVIVATPRTPQDACASSHGVVELSCPVLAIKATGLSEQTTERMWIYGAMAVVGVGVGIGVLSKLSR